MPMTPTPATAQSRISPAKSCPGKPLGMGEPDWAGIAADLNGYAENPPANIPLFLAAAFVLAGQLDFALYEIESVDPSTLKAQHDKELVAFARALIYSSHGWRLSAVLACQEIPGTSPALSRAAISQPAGRPCCTMARCGWPSSARPSSSTTNTVFCFS